MQEQRQYPRVPVLADLPVTDVNSGKMLGRVVNISAGGMMLYVDTRIAIHSVFQVSIYLPEGGDPVKMGVENLWCTMSSNPSGFWAGFHVIDISDQDRDRLVEFSSDQEG